MVQFRLRKNVLRKLLLSNNFRGKEFGKKKEKKE